MLPQGKSGNVLCIYLRIALWRWDEDQDKDFYIPCISSMHLVLQSGHVERLSWCLRLNFKQPMSFPFLIFKVTYSIDTCLFSSLRWTDSGNPVGSNVSRKHSLRPLEREYAKRVTSKDRVHPRKTVAINWCETRHLRADSKKSQHYR